MSIIAQMELETKPTLPYYGMVFVVNLREQSPFLQTPLIFLFIFHGNKYYNRSYAGMRVEP